MIPADLHNHTSFSPDSEAPLSAMAARAEELGFRYFGVTEHVDLDYEAYGIEIVPTDLEAYRTEFFRQKAAFAPRLELLFGAEFAFHPEASPRYAALNERFPFDYVIQSVHAVEGKDPYFADYFEGREKEGAYGAYFERVLESLEAPYRFEILGHVGYCLRGAPYPDKLTLSPRHLSVLDEIFRAAVRREIAVEINTNVRGCGSLTLPTPEMLRRYFALGGRLITFGSDAHQPRRVGENRDWAEHLAREIGFTEWCVFQGRKRLLLPLG